MPSQKVMCSLVHFLRIERIIVKGRVARHQRVLDRSVPDLIAVGLAHSAETRVEILRHLLGFLNPDIGRQPRVHRDGNLVHRHSGLRVEHRDIPQGMYPGVCPARPCHMDLLLQQLRQMPVELSLDRISFRLNLPAMIMGPVIGDRQFDSFHIFTKILNRICAAT